MRLTIVLGDRDGLRIRIEKVTKKALTMLVWGEKDELGHTLNGVVATRTVEGYDTTDIGPGNGLRPSGPAAFAQVRALLSTQHFNEIMSDALG